MADIDQEIYSFEQEDESKKDTKTDRIQPIANGLHEKNHNNEKEKLLDEFVDSEEEEDSERDDYHSSSQHYDGIFASMWFMEPAVRRNYYIVILILLFFIGGIGCFVVGVIFEVLYHTVLDNVLRGLAFMIVAILILIPSGYALLHMYLAAKRVGRVRFSSVWFFRY